MLKNAVKLTKEIGIRNFTRVNKFEKIMRFVAPVLKLFSRLITFRPEKKALIKTTDILAKDKNLRKYIGGESSLNLPFYQPKFAKLEIIAYGNINSKQYQQRYHSDFYILTEHKLYLAKSIFEVQKRKVRPLKIEIFSKEEETKYLMTILDVENPENQTKFYTTEYEIE